MTDSSDAPLGEEQGGARAGAQRGPSHGRGSRPGGRWAWPAGVLAIGAAVAAVLVLTDRGAPEPVAVPEAEVVTLPAPSPTIEPVDPGGGTAFFGVLPRTVLAYALQDAAEHPPLIAAGALEGYRLLYSDGGTELTVHAGQWRDAAGAEAALADALALEAPGVAGEPSGEVSSDDTAAGDGASDGSTAPPGTAPGVEQGAVEVDGEQVGRYVSLTRADGSGSLWWTNGTALVQVDGPAGALQDVHAAFPI